MKNVTVRQAQINLSKLLKELPFQITRYGKPIATVNGVGEEIVSKPQETVQPIAQRYGFCEGHFERSKEYVLRLVAYETPDNMESAPKWICSGCISRIESEVKRNGGRIIFK